MSECEFCSILYSKIRIPKILDCGHQICSVCFQQKNCKVFCSECNKQTSRNSVEQLKTNRSALKQIQKQDKQLEQILSSPSPNNNQLFLLTEVDFQKKFDISKFVKQNMNKFKNSEAFNFALKKMQQNKDKVDSVGFMNGEAIGSFLGPKGIVVFTDLSSCFSYKIMNQLGTFYEQALLTFDLTASSSEEEKQQSIRQRIQQSYHDKHQRKSEEEKNKMRDKFIRYLSARQIIKKYELAVK